MNAIDSPIALHSVEIGLGLLALGLLFGAWLSRRARIEPLGHWPMAWAVLVGIGAARVAGGSVPLEYAGTAIYGALMLTGAYRYAGRELPWAILPAAACLAALLPLLAYAGFSDLPGWITLVLTPLALVAAAGIVAPAAFSPEVSFVHRLLPFGLVVLAGLGIYDDVATHRSDETIQVWLVAGIPIATTQAVAVFDRIRQRTDDISRALAESVSLLQATLESTADGILVVGSDGRYTSFNQIFVDMWRIPTEILAKSESEPVLRFAMQQLEDPEDFYRTVQTLYHDSEAESFDTLRFADGRVFERYSRPQRVGDEIVGRVWSFRDVTTRVQAEEIAAGYQGRLEELVEQRTRELVASRDRLRQSDRLAAIGTLAAGVAHQINNPIGAILNSAQFALSCEADDDAKETYQRALAVNAEEAKRCAGIVRSMLQFARQEPVDKRLEDFNAVVQRATRAVERQALDRGVHIDTALSEQPLQARMSPIEMEQVVVNVVQNAVEASEPGSVVEVRAWPGLDSARLEVRDTGCGIDEEDREHIFDPFFSTRLAQGGTGLGLSVAHGILTDHGATIRVESEAGKGTTLTIDLPLEPPAEPPRPTEAPAARAGSDPGSQASPHGGDGVNRPERHHPRR